MVAVTDVSSGREGEPGGENVGPLAETPTLTPGETPAIPAAASIASFTGWTCGLMAWETAETSFRFLKPWVARMIPRMAVSAWPKILPSSLSIGAGASDGKERLRSHLS